MKWGILGALDAEIELIRKHMDIKRETPLFGTVFYEGTVSGQSVRSWQSSLSVFRINHLP